MIGIRQELTRRLETSLCELKPGIVERWVETALQKSRHLRFASPLPGAVYRKLVERFIDALCDSLGRDDLESAAAFWPEQARTGPLSGHAHDEVVHLCSTACRSVGEAVDHVVEGSEDGPSVRIATQRILGRIQDSLEPAAEPRAEQEGVAVRSDLDALVSAAQHLREGLAWSELYDRDIRRSRRLELLRLMLVETRGLAPAQAAESILRRLHGELPCRACLLVRQAASRTAVRLESAWPRAQLGRELGEEMHVADGALERFPPGTQTTTCDVDHDSGELDAELLGFGARAMFVTPLPRAKDAAAWLILGLHDETALAPDDVEFTTAAAAVLGAVLDNALVSAQLSEAVGRLGAVIRSMPEPVVLVDPAGLVLDASEAAPRLLGLDRDDLIRHNIGETNTLGTPAEIKAMLESAQAGTGPVPRVLVGRRADGSLFRAACCAAALDENTLIFAFRNVTNIARAAKAHREAKVLHRALFDAATDLVFLVDRDGRCLDVSRTALAAFGLEPGHVVDRTPAELFDADTAAHVEELLSQVLQSGAPTTFSTTLPGDDAPTFEVTLSPVRNAAGDLTAVLGVARNVTIARRLIDRPVESMADDRLVADDEPHVAVDEALVADERPIAVDDAMRSVPIGIAVLDEQGRVIAANDALANLLRPGDTADALAGTDLVSAHDAPLHAIARQLDEAREGATVISRPFPFTRPAGVGETWCAVRARAIGGEGEERVRLLVVVEDVTEHVRLQSDLVKTERAAAVGHLVAELAEDLNNRLGPVLGHAQMLQHRKIGIGEMAHVNAIERCAQSLRRIVESLLAFAKPAAPAPRACNVNDTIREACALVEDDCKAQHVRLALDLDVQLPTTLADARQLGQVVLNLLNNARQAMAERGGTITVTSSSQGGAIVVTVADTGEGIDPDELERIFESSYTTRTARFGAGLGLTIAQAIVRNHGGTIGIESKRHRGTTVRIELPIRSPSGTHADGARPRPAGPPKPLHILLADSDDEMLGMTKKLLVGDGNRVVACATARAMLQALRDGTFDVVVADLGMPGLSGVDLHARLAAEWPELASRIVFTTARICDTRTSAFIHNTGGRLVTKPFDVRDLLAALADIAAPPRD